MRIDTGLRFRQWEYWILFLLSQADHGTLSLDELRRQIGPKMNLSKRDWEPTRESKGKPRWDTDLRSALYWGPKSLKSRKLIRNDSHSGIYEITPQGREQLKTYEGPPTPEDEEVGI